MLSKKDLGFGLLEVLVSLLVLSISLLAIAGLHSRALQYNHSAYVRSQVNILAYDMFDRIRANRANITNYQLAYSDTLAVPGATCSGSLVQKDTCEWQQHMQMVLPNAQAQLACATVNGDPLYKCDIAIRWTEDNLFGSADNDELDAETRSTFSYSTSI